MYHLDQRKYEAIQLTFKQVRHDSYLVNSTFDAYMYLQSVENIFATCLHQK